MRVRIIRKCSYFCELIPLRPSVYISVGSGMCLYSSIVHVNAASFFIFVDDDDKRFGSSLSPSFCLISRVHPISGIPN